MNNSDVIDKLGGTNEVALLCNVSPQAVSQWRKDGIPDARIMYLKLLRPDVFSTAPQRDCPQPPPMQEAA